MQQALYIELAQLVGAYHRCKSDNTKKDWESNHKARILALVKEHMPSGSGFDNGTKIDLDASTEEKLVFNTSFHHMDDNGHYDGWTDHTVTVRPSLAFGIKITMSGRDRNDLKDHMHEVFSTTLREIIKPVAA